MRRFSPSPTAFYRLTVVAVILLAAIVVTGGAVRLTNSGLGCPTWPKCTATSVTAPWTFHGQVEFLNRVVSFLVGLIIFVVALAATTLRPRRRDLTWLSWSLVAGFLGQGVVGGLSVIFHLAPGWVMAHFLLSMLLLWAALVLLHRCTPGWAAEPAGTVRIELRWLGRLLVLAGGIVLFLGTVTTGAGPHAGDPGKVHRLGLPLERVTQLHADSALFLTGLVVATLVALRLADVPESVRRRGRLLLAAVAGQVVIGYTQYFLDLPRGLVLLHIAGATGLWCAAVWLQLGLTEPPADATRAEPARSGFRAA